MPFSISITESPPRPAHYLYSSSSSTKKRAKEKRRRSSSHGKDNRSSPLNTVSTGTSTAASLSRSIYCPRSETTYEGEMRINYYQEKVNNDDDCNDEKISTILSTATNKSNNNNSTFPFFIKHGKGTIHNHRDNTTLVGFFQNNQIMGHALQTFYDDKGKCAIARYEGAFIPELKSEFPLQQQKQQQQHYPNHQEEKEEKHGQSLLKSPNNNMNESASFFNVDNYLRHGFGKYSWPLTSDEYVGEFHRGAMQGKGTFSWGSTGERYEGYWYKGRMHGEKGKKLSAFGDEFMGTFVKGRATGWGRKNFCCGDVHIGMYRKDKRHGFGTYKWKNGDLYDGQWQYGRMFGRGVKTLVYTPERGNILDRVNNNGMQRGDIAERFHGTLVNDKAQGYGVKYYACGDEYCGQYQNDMRHGYGVYTWTTGGERYSGEWKNGHICGVGIKIMTNGDSYDGEFFDDLAHGFGVKTFGSTGDIHYGEYQFNCRHGKGLYRWANGDEYDGNYDNGEQSGHGCFRLNDASTVYKGQWSRGQKHGPGFFKYLREEQDVVTEYIFFEVWSNGDLVFREILQYSWDDLPEIDCLPSYHSWKHIWINTDNFLERSHMIGPEHFLAPMVEDGSTALDPFPEDYGTLTFQPQPGAGNSEDSEYNNVSRRHYSIDYYSSIVPDEARVIGKPRSSSFSSYLGNSNASHNAQERKRNHSSQKIRKGGFVVVSGLRRKIRISRF